MWGYEINVKTKQKLKLQRTRQWNSDKNLGEHFLTNEMVGRCMEHATLPVCRCKILDRLYMESGWLSPAFRGKEVSVALCCFLLLIGFHFTVAPIFCIFTHFCIGNSVFIYVIRHFHLLSRALWINFTMLFCILNYHMHIITWINNEMEDESCYLEQNIEINTWGWVRDTCPGQGMLGLDSRWDGNRIF